MDGSAHADVGEVKSLFEMLCGLRHSAVRASCGLQAGQKKDCTLWEADQPRPSSEQSVCDNDADRHGEVVRILAQLSADVPELLPNTTSAHGVQLGSNLLGNGCSSPCDAIRCTAGGGLLPLGRLSQNSILGGTLASQCRQGADQHTALLRFTAPPPCGSASVGNGDLAINTSSCVSDEPCWLSQLAGHGFVLQSAASQPVATNTARHNAFGAAASFVTDMGVGPGGTDRVGAWRWGGHRMTAGCSAGALHACPYQPHYQRGAYCL
jgi:hypothetical protein